MARRFSAGFGMLIAAALFGALTACGPESPPVEEKPLDVPSTTPGSSVTVDYLEVGSGDTWQVAVLRPSPHPPDACAEDESVASSIISLDMPSSHVSYSLHPGSSEDDAKRVAACLEKGLTSGAITVTPPVVKH